VGAYTLPLDQVLKIEILEKDKAKTRASYGAGIAIGVGGAALLVAAFFATRAGLGF
jgi:hypothetical protein